MSKDPQSASARIVVRLLDGKRCTAHHPSSDTSIITEVAAEYGGSGDHVSSTDLVAAALGTCIGSSLAPVVQREGIPLELVQIHVTKQLGTEPKRIARLDVAITVPVGTTATQQQKLRNAARTCPVKRSLAGTTVVDIRISN